ncbi:STAS domain-containing protein [Streptomyces sp. NPDC059695]|uniref:STAS domain-containing protein n=1 Tax=Streptomyces sp. NPDC059695 TaxID=3346910 RepID=UPI0036C9FB19
MNGEDRADCDVLFTYVPNGQVYSAPGGAGVYREATGADGTALLQATGELDTDSVTCMRQAVADALDEGATCVRVDLTGIAFGDVSLIDTLLDVQEGPARLVLVAPLPRRLHHLFDITGTTGRFHFEA